MFYLDTSAAVKLVVAERGSAALRRWPASRDGRVISSDLLRTELIRATRRAAPEEMLQARRVLDSLMLITISTAICERAAILSPTGLRCLDALHLSAAMELGDELGGIVTYDERMADGALSLGIEVYAPG